MGTVYCGLSALSIALLFYSWRGYHDKLICRHRQLRERVTFMLWVAANGLNESR